MVVREKLRKYVLGSLKNVGVLNPENYGRKNHAFFNRLYSRNIIDDSFIEGGLEFSVFKRARRDYNILRKRNYQGYSNFADDVGSTQAFGYALANGLFSDKEIKKIPFERGDSLENFILKYGSRDILSSIKDKILNPKPESDHRSELGPEDLDHCVTCD